MVVYILSYAILLRIYCINSMETSRILRVGTRNNILRIAAVSLEHVLV